MHETETRPHAQRAGSAAILCTAGACLLSLLTALLLAQGWSYIAFFDALRRSFQLSCLWMVPGCFFLSALTMTIQGTLTVKAFRAAPGSILPHLSAPVGYAAALLALRLFCDRWMPVPALIAILYYPCAFFLWDSMQKGRGKSQTVFYAVAPALLLSAAVFVLQALQSSGAKADFLFLYFDRLANAAETLAERCSEWMIASIGGQEGVEQLVELGVFAKDVTVELLHGEQTELFDSFIVSAFLISPGVVGALTGICSYLSVLILHAEEKKAGKGRKDYVLQAPAFAFIVFMASFLLYAGITMLTGIRMPSSAVQSAYVINSSSLRVAGAVLILVTNLLLFLTPLFFGVGVRALTHLNKKMLAEHKILAGVTLLFLILVPIPMITAIGLYFTSAERMRKKLEDMWNEDPPEL